MKYEEPYEYALRMAKKQLETSDHLTYVTYQTVKNPKFLISISEHLMKSAKLALQALLEFELAYKRIDSYVNKIDSQIDVFEDELYPRYGFTSEHLKLLSRLKRIDEKNKGAVIRFRRDDRYYFGGPRMETESVGIDDIKTLLKYTKSFIARVSNIISKERNG